jgi:hypothetical protein
VGTLFGEGLTATLGTSVRCGVSGKANHRDIPKEREVVNVADPCTIALLLPAGISCLHTKKERRGAEVTTAKEFKCIVTQLSSGGIKVVMETFVRDSQLERAFAL